MSQTRLSEWDAQAYHRLGSPQHAWGRKVLERLLARLEGSETILDAGCGTGRVTAEILEQLPGARVVALDRSAEMIEVARQTLAPFGDRVRCVCGDLASLDLDGEVDAVFSTATFHWVHDHASLFARLHRALRPGARGWLVAQCGGGPNLERIHRRAAVNLASPPFADFFEGYADPWYFAMPEATRARLETAGFVEVETGLEEAPTTLSGATEYGEFMATVVFGRHLTRVPDAALRERFIADMVEAGARDDPPWSLDYWRLNLQGRRAR
ncbi:MAG: class I SAM-dependent methyltransferase [Polyangiaceae bacterium]